MMLKGVLLTAYLVISMFLFINFETSAAVWVSFMVNNLSILGITLYHLYAEEEYSPFISVYIVFSFLFFIVAPIIQINVIGGRNEAFVTKFPYRESVVIASSYLISFFNVVFFLGYIFFKRIKRPQKFSQLTVGVSQRLPGVIIILLVLTLVSFVGSWSFIQEEISRPSWVKSSASVSALLLWKKVLFLIPFAGVILCVQYLKQSKKHINNIIFIALVLVLFLVFLFWFKNPLTEKRNALGPIYIGLIFLFLPRLLNSNAKTLFFMFFSMVVVFPLSAIITHTSATMREILIKPRILLDQFEGEGIGEVFNTLHYDAFANIGATIDYIGYEGYAYGNQLLGAFFFFVPRGLWQDKPISTGQLVGEHLIDTYDFTYSNLSNPMVSEGYINFGIFGIILLALLLAASINYLKTWLQSKDYLKMMMGFYFAIHLLFFLRGDFMNGYSYYIGTLIGVLVIPRCIDYFLQQLLMNQQKWKMRQAAKA